MRPLVPDLTGGQLLARWMYGPGGARFTGYARSIRQRRVPFWTDLFSIEASFALFLFAGRYKNFAELNSFPVDLTLLFFGLTIGLVAWALTAGRMKTVPPNTPALLMLLFSTLATISVFWSSLDTVNIEKAARFLSLTVTSFFVAYLISATRERRDRLVRNLAYLNIVILLYFFYYRYVLGIDVQAGGDIEVSPDAAGKYAEYAQHAGFLVLSCLALAIFGTRRQRYAAAAGAALGWFALISIGGRGPLALTILAVPLAVAGLLLRHFDARQRIAHLAMVLVTVIGMAAVAYGMVTTISGQALDLKQFHTLERYQLQLSGDNTRSVDMREVGQDFALSQWLERPVLGWGMGEFRIQRPELQWPHNLLLEILVENGVIAGFLFTALGVASLLACIRLIRDPSARWTDATVALWVLTELVSHVTAEGYLADDRVFFAFMGIVVAPRLLWRRP